MRRSRSVRVEYATQENYGKSNSGIVIYPCRNKDVVQIWVFRKYPAYVVFGWCECAVERIRLDGSTVLGYVKCLGRS